MADDIKAQLRALRDRLAFEVPRARARSQTPPALLHRLVEGAELVGRVFLLLGSSTTTSAVDEIAADALVEAHLALTDWETWLTQERQAPRAPALGPTERRQHERHETNVTVSLRRHSLRAEGASVSANTQTASRPARNLSLGGILVTANPTDLPEVAVGSVLHVSANAAARSFQLRGVVARRDPNGIALRWVVESPADQRAVEALIEAARGAKPKDHLRA